jgi:4a-hydroxytetrahydrobiopterin dehydratase
MNKRLTDDEIDDRLKPLSGWTHTVNTIEKTYRFKNFLRAMWFVNAVGYLAESMNHHPDIHIHYNEVRLANWTHVAGGLTELDFTLAEKIDAMVEESMKSER